MDAKIKKTTIFITAILLGSVLMLPNFTPTAKATTPDLSPESISTGLDYGQISPETGKPVHIFADIYKKDVSVNSFITKFYIRKEGILRTVLEEHTAAYSDTYSESYSTIPTSIWSWTPREAGTYEIQVIVDVSNNIAESNENNNTLTKTITVSQGSSVILPDLRPTSISLWQNHQQSHYYTNEQVDITGGIFTDNTDANTFVTKMYIKKAGDNNANNWIEHTAVFAGSPNTMNIWTWTPTEAAAYTVQLIVDIEVDISEANENNNILEQTLVVEEFVHISNEQLQLTPAQATVTWTTDVPATSYVYYVRQGLINWSWQGDDALVTSHSVILPDLWPSTTYKYNIRSSDADGHLRQTADKTFTTSVEEEAAGPVISNAQLRIQPTQVTVTWGTDIPASSFVSYVKKGQSSWSWQGSDELTTSHTVVVPYLEPLTTYQYDISSTDAAGNKTETPDSTFTTTDQITQIENNAKLIQENNFDDILTELAELRNTVKEQEAEIKYLTKIVKATEKLSDVLQEMLVDFIAYGVDENTQKIGASERAGVVNSFKSSFGRWPAAEKDWQDILKIANGRWPSQSSAEAESKAAGAFKKIYLRAPNMNNAHENAAVTVMAYGLRPAARNLDSERAAIGIFKGIYGFNPASAFDWDIVRAISYSGASR